MAEITVTGYECDRDLLPPVCAKCGAPAEHRVTRRTRYLRDDWAVWKPAALMAGLALFPPLFFWIAYRHAAVAEVRVPVCDAHASDWVWRDHILFGFLMPAWATLVAAAYLVGLVVYCNGGDGGVAIFAGPVLATLAALIDNCVINYRAVKVLKAHPGDGVKLTGVHPAFIDAIQADRARSRVWDPDRRPERGDERHDYNDEPV